MYEAARELGTAWGAHQAGRLTETEPVVGKPRRQTVSRNRQTEGAPTRMDGSCRSCEKLRRTLLSIRVSAVTQGAVHLPPDSVFGLYPDTRAVEKHAQLAAGT